MILKKIEYTDYPALKKFFKHQKHRLCIYSLPSIMAWSNEYYMPYGAVENDALIIAAEFTKKKEDRHLILPISPSKEYSPEELYELAGKLGFSSYWFVPGDYLEKQDKNTVRSLFRVTVQKEYEDYVYNTEDLSGLKGNKYSQKRNLIHQFERDYLSRGRAETGRITASNESECIDFLEKWCEERDCGSAGNYDLACEKEAAVNTIRNISSTDAEGIYLRVDGKISAFGIACYLTDDTGVLHFEKAFAGIKGLYQYFDKLCANSLFSGYSYINKESDMNIPGLAKVKQSYHPALRIKSYRLDLR